MLIKSQRLFCRPATRFKETMSPSRTWQDNMSTNNRKKTYYTGSRRRPQTEKVVQKSPGTAAPKPKVSVLLLTFGYRDLGPDLDRETEDVLKAFEGLGYAVKSKSIDMRRPRKSLLRSVGELAEHFVPTGSHGEGDADLSGDSDSHEDEDENEDQDNIEGSHKDKKSNPDDLLIIYYHGHGGMNKPGEFAIASHNYPSSDYLIESLLDKINEVFRGPATLARTQEIFKELQPIAMIAWKEIHEFILKIKCDTLVILDCCDAGLASAMGSSPDDETSVLTTHRKELLAACTWGNETRDRMSRALCDALDSIGIGDANGLSTLVRKMNNSLSKQNVENAEKSGSLYSVPQAAHYVLGRTKVERIILKNLRVSDDLGKTEPGARHISV